MLRADSLPGLIVGFFVLATTLSSDSALGVPAIGDPIQSGSEYEYPPFAAVRPDGTADGFSVDLLRAALKAMGRDVEFKVGPWHELKAELANGRLQVLPLMARSEARDHHYDFSVPYFTMHGTVIMRKAARRINDVTDLRGREVIVMRGDIADEYLEAHQITDKIFRTETIAEALRQLADGQHDAVVVQKLAGQALIRSLELANLEVVGSPITEYQQFCFAVRNGDHELLAVLNEGLALVVADGTYARLQEKWLGPVQENRAPYLVVILAVMVTLILAWFVALFWQRSLLRLVHARTVELHDSNLSLMHEIREHHNTEQALRRKSEELEATFSNVHVLLTIMDRDFNYLQVNAAFADACGRSPDAFVGRNHFDFYPDAENEAILRRVVATGEPYTASAKPFGYPDPPEHGTRYWDWTLTPVTDSHGRVEAVVLALIDATERERQRQEAEVNSRISQEVLELRVRARTAELEAAYQELESFSYSVSHDLRGPLRAINGFSHLLAEDFDTSVHPEGLVYIDRIHNATVRMGELIDGLLNLAQVFRSELQCTSVNLSAMAHEVVLLEAIDADAHTDIRIQQDVTAIGDPTLLRVVLQNLLSNAMKFSRHRPNGVIQFGTTVQDRRVVYYVRDTGIGFDMQYAHKLFQPFERLHDGESYQGTGVGLATVRRIVLRHRGRVWAEGAPEHGATFYFTLNDL